jgi:hypothetical protein
MLFLKLAYTTHSSGGEIQNEVTQKRKKIFEFFAKKKIHSTARNIISRSSCCRCRCCGLLLLLLRVRGTPFSGRL